MVIGNKGRISTVVVNFAPETAIEGTQADLNLITSSAKTTNNISSSYLMVHWPFAFSKAPSRTETKNENREQWRIRKRNGIVET